MQGSATRRQAILLLIAAAAASAQAGRPGTTIHQKVDFQVPAERIYAALLDAKEFSAFTGLSAEIPAQPGVSLTMFGELIEGPSGYYRW